MQEASLFSTSPPALVICGLMKEGHSGWCEVVSHGSLIGISLIIRDVEHFFHVVAGHLYIFLGERCRTVWKYLKNLFIELPYDPAVPLLGIYLEKSFPEKDTCICMLIAAPFTIAKT